jgi:predicted transcriptional regulator
LEVDQDYPVIIDATFNQWGASSGPFHPDNNSAGTGDNVSDYVNFRPWRYSPGRNPAANLTGFVIDSDGNPIEGAMITISCSSNIEVFADSSGYYFAYYLPIIDCVSTITASMEGYESSTVKESLGGEHRLNFTLSNKGSRNSDDSLLGIPPLPLAIASVGLLGLLGISFIREDIRFIALSFLVAPLYSKLEKDEILEQANRREIYTRILKKPGTNLTNLHNALPMGYGSLVHHLKVLQRSKHIRSKKELGRRMFFPTSSNNTNGLNPSNQLNEFPKTKTSIIHADPTSDHETKAISDHKSETIYDHKTNNVAAGGGGGAEMLETLSSVPVGFRIIEFLNKNGPSTMREIEDGLSIKQTTVSYNIRKMISEGSVRGSGEKLKARYSMVEGWKF